MPLGSIKTSAVTAPPQLPTRSDAELHANDAKIAIKLGGVDVVGQFSIAPTAVDQTVAKIKHATDYRLRLMRQNQT